MTHAWLLGAAHALLVQQATRADVVGTIRSDQYGEPVAGALVSLADLDRAVVTDPHGRYVLRDVPPGPQHLVVKRIGYEPRTLHALVPRAGRLDLSVALRRLPVRLRTVEVRPPVEMGTAATQGAPADGGRGVSMAAARHHPLLAEPDALLALGGGEVAFRAESPSGVHIRGGASDRTAYLLDGIPVFSPYHTAGVFSAWNPDALDRVDVSSSAPSMVVADGLSGAVGAVTRPPGARVRVMGALSTTQTRLATEGPLGRAGAGYLVALRAGFPSQLAPRGEPSYLSGEDGDLLAKLEGPALGGSARLVGYDTHNEYSLAASGDTTEPRRVGPRNDVAWRSRSVGGAWRRTAGPVSVRLQGWSASTGAEATWDADERAAVHMTARRRDLGASAVVERRAAGTATTAGASIRHSATAYHIAPGPERARGLALDARTPVTAGFVQHERPLGARLAASVALSVAAASGRAHWSPQSQLRWTPSSRLALTGGVQRSHQFAQSLRNPESLSSNVFPPDLFIGSGAPGAPVARGDQAEVGADYRPTSGARLGARAFARHATGLLLVAPRTGAPFATDGLATGSERARGLSLDAAMSGAHYGVMGSYAWQRVRLAHEGTRYAPGHAAGHLAEAGVIVFPSSTLSFRLGATAAAGRRATAVAGAFEWEPCNLLDRGCEFGGSARYDTDRLGTTRLPAYLRLDLGVRKHLHVRVAGRDAALGLFGTATNILGRTNLLTLAVEPGTGRTSGIEMRPFAPLVVGVDWRY